MSEGKKVLLVDDHPILLEGLSKLINDYDDLRVCGTTESEAGVLDAIEAFVPDLIIMDIGLKNSNGLNIIKTLKSQNVTIPILVLSMYDELLYAERCLKAGAMGYLMKQEAPEKVIEAIRRILSGSVFVSENITETLVQRSVGGSKGAGAPASESLTDRELEVFEMIGKGLGTRDIATRLNLSVKTVETYRERIKEKLGFTSGIQLVQQAHNWIRDEGTPP